MVALRIVSWIARLSGLVALLLGLLFWAVDINLFTAPMVSNPSFIVIHIIFGILVALSLLVLSIALMTTKGGRVLGVVGFVYALIVPIFGELQLGLDVGGAPWLVPTIHLLIGIGAIGLSAVIVSKYSMLKEASANSTKNSAESGKKGKHPISQKTIQSTRQILSTPRSGHMTLLTSFRRDGKGIGTPVGTVASDGKLYFMTAADTWKVKRLASDPHVTVALGNRKGEALSPAIEGTVRRLSAQEAQSARKLLRIGIVGRLFGIIFDRKYPGEKTAVYEISLVAESVDHTLTASSLS